MKYTKEQAEMLALLVLMGCAVVVLAFLYLVKPNFASISKSRTELKKTEAEIAQLSKAKVELAKANKEMQGLTTTIKRGEGAVFSGLETDPPLSAVCVLAATKLDLKPAYGVQTTSGLLEFKERGADGKEVTRHYDEVSRTLNIQTADFFTLCRFLAAVEKANDGLRVTDLKIENSSVDPQDREKGKVNANLELRMLGIREGQRGQTTIDASGSEDFDVGNKRNPFGPAGGALASADDPLRSVKEALRRIKITGVWAEELIMEVPKSGSITVRKGEAFAVGRIKMRYLSGFADSFVFEATDYGKRYRLGTNSKGEVKTITEEETK